MRVIADLHVHSKYARATSPQCNIPGLSMGAKTKGISLIATGDFTHPVYFEEVKNSFTSDQLDAGSKIGLYEYDGVHFILSSEVSVIYREGGSKNSGGSQPVSETDERAKKMHHVMLAPSVEIAAQVNDRLAKYGNLKADGRPILKMSSAALMEELNAISPQIILIPAHVWTPWFSVFGSKSGVDTIEEAFQDQAHRIFALETGLSSDPAMNWMLSSLDKYTLVSNSDAHSLGKLGREANVFDLPEVSFSALSHAMRTKEGFIKTYEFYPEEGKYHYDGHRECKVLLTPWESKENKNICPVCRRKLTIGVMHRIADLADRKFGYKPEKAVPFKHIIPLQTLISKAIHKPETSRVIGEELDKLVRYFGNEFAVFEASEDQVRLSTSKEIADAIIRSNQGRVRWIPGYDGVFGELILEDDKPAKKAVDKKQKKLDDY
jgi:uncharacterized protein (TIGR00375 family)